MSLSWRHTTRLSVMTIDHLCRQHQSSIRDIRIYNMSLGNLSPVLPNITLTTLHLGDISPMHPRSWQEEIIAANCGSLKSLRRSREKELALCHSGYKDFRLDEEISHFTFKYGLAIKSTAGKLSNSKGVENKESQPFGTILEVESLDLIGFDLPSLF